MSNINWSMLITKAMKEATAAALYLSEVTKDLNSRKTVASNQIARIQDRINTIGFGVEIGIATPEEELEAKNLAVLIVPWKRYKYDLDRVAQLPTWPKTPTWPAQPPIPVIAASPMGISAK